MATLYRTNVLQMDLQSQMNVLDYAVLGAKTHESPMNDGVLYVQAYSRSAADNLIRKLQRGIPDIKLMD